MSVFTREMVEQAIEAEYGHTFVHWREELNRWIESEAQRRAEEYANSGPDNWKPTW